MIVLRLILVAYDPDGMPVVEEIRPFTSLEAAKNAASTDHPEWGIYTIDADTGEAPEWCSHREVTRTDAP